MLIDNKRRMNQGSKKGEETNWPCNLDSGRQQATQDSQGEAGTIPTRPKTDNSQMKQNDANGGTKVFHTGRDA